MARPPDWFDRLDALQATLRASEIPSLGRREMQELFACSERESLRLLNRFGAVKIGDTLQLARRALLTQLEALRASRTFQLFRQKQQQLSETMAVARPASKARFRRIAGSVEFVPRTWTELSADITLEPGRLEVRFATEEDLWFLLDQLADVAAQDGEGFRARIEPADSEG